MPTVECLITRDGRLLMSRRPQGKSGAGMLLPIGGPVEPGESPLQACLREVREETGLHVSPSCVAVIFNEAPGQTIDYRLTFVADAPAGEPVPGAAGSLEWVDLSELTGRDDVPAHDRELIPRLLASSGPLAVVLDVDTSTDPWTRRLRDISPIDPARLGPLVFGVTT